MPTSTCSCCSTRRPAGATGRPSCSPAAPHADAGRWAGETLGRLHAATAGDAEVAAAFGDYEAFAPAAPRSVLRSRRCSGSRSSRPHCEPLVEELRNARVCLVHGDYAPKNMLLGRDGSWLLDAEVAHVGQPGLRSGLLPRLPAAHGRAEARARGGLQRARRRLHRDATRAARAPLRAVAGVDHRPHRARCCSRAPTAARPRPSSRRAAARRARALGKRLLLDPAPDLDGGRSLVRMSDRCDRARARLRGARLARHADGRLRRSRSPVAPRRARRCRPAPRRARTRRTSGATAARATAGAACAAPSPPSTARSPRALRGRDAADQAVIDAALRDLDGTPSLARLGANAVLAASLACALAAAEAARVPLWRLLAPGAPPLLPLPMVNVLSGGAHAGRAVDVQDVLVIPLAATHVRRGDRARGARARGAAAELRAARPRHGARRRRGRPGGAARIQRGGARDRHPRHRARRASRPRSRSTSPRRSSCDGDGYRLAREDRRLDGAALAREVAGWARRYPLVSIEDPLGEDDWEAWRLVTELLGDRACSCSATTSSRPRPSGSRTASPRASPTPCSSSPTRPARSRMRARRSSWRSARATRPSSRRARATREDAWLADLAVGWRSGQIKVGSTQRSERTAKWNRLLRIEAERPGAELAPWRVARPRSSTV